MQLYLPFKKEEELFPYDAKKCFEKFKKKSKYIQKVKDQVMKHLTQVEEGRAHAEDILANEIGDELDANKEQEETDDLLEGVHEHPELYIKDPTEINDNLKMETTSNNIFRKIDLQDTEEIHSKVRKLDIDQQDPGSYNQKASLWLLI